MKIPYAAILVFVLCANTSVVHAEVSVPAIFSSHMVLQQGVECPVWGFAAAGEKVTVTFAGQTAKATADDKGNWMVKLKPLPANATPQTLTVAGQNTLTIEDVLVGEVWLCSGQSNMEWSLSQATDGKNEAAKADNPLIRHIKLEHRGSDAPVTDVPSKGWTNCTPQTAGAYTAVGYYFAQYLTTELKVPVGLIGSNWGGTRIEPWTAPEGYKQVTSLNSLATTNKPKLYNGMIYPLVPFAIKGTLWYQGESNNGEGMKYFEKMQALILGWREMWKYPDMPFYYVQLAPFTYKGNPKSLAEMWDAQTAALSIPHTGMAGTSDIGTPKNIHPPNKKDVGKRLALWALAKTYDKPIAVYSGPIFKSMKIKGNQAELLFHHSGSGLTARDGKELTHFEVAGEDKNFVPAKARVEGSTVVVAAEGVAKPVAVRFAWDQVAEPNLSNKEGLPAIPFRTDNWPPEPPPAGKDK
jgi:sialate O-acetylesterase